MSRLVRLARLVLALVVLVLSGARPALAEGESPRHVEVVLVGQLAMDPVFAARVTSWFAGERFHVTVRKARWLEPRQVLAPSADAAVHVWVTLNGNTLARLYFASEHGPSGGPSYFLRELRLDNGLDEIGAEHVAEVLNLSTLAFLEGQAQSAREELEQSLRAEPAPQPAPAPPVRAVEKPVPPSAVRKPSRDAGATHRRSRQPWGARLGYAASYRADEGTWHGPCAAFELALWRKLGLRVEALGALPAERELTPLELRFYGVAFALTPSLRQELGAGVDLQWFVGPGLELVRYAPVRPLSSEYQAGAAATEARPALTGGVAALWGREPVLAVVAQATLPLTKTHYDVVRAQAREVIGRASPIVPTLGVEVGF
jgi:hypothetical protein